MITIKHMNNGMFFTVTEVDTLSPDRFIIPDSGCQITIVIQINMPVMRVTMIGIRH